MIIYSYYIPEIEEAIFLPDSTSLFGYGEYIGIAIPAAFMTCTDWWVFELMIFTSGMFGVFNQAAQILLMNIAMFLYFVAQGFAFVGTTLIGNELGKGNVLNAKHYKRVIQFNATIIILVVSVLLYYCKEQLVASLTNIPLVYDRAMDVVYLLIFNTFPEQFKGINKGIIRGLNLQGKSVYIHLSGNWGLNICLQYYFLVI